MPKIHRDTIAIFHNVRSAYNVGSLFRTADGAGVSKLYLTGYTPAPVDRFGREVRMIAKTALGAEENISWETGDIDEVILSLKTNGYSIIAVEQSPHAVSYRTFKAPQKAAFLFGSEVEGLNEEILALCDRVIMIPMHGRKESLNVSVAAGIILFHYSSR